MPNLPEDYLPTLLAGDAARLLAGFAGAPVVDDPLSGHISGAAALEALVREKQAWLAERAARLEPVRVTQTPARTVVETLVHLQLSSGPAEWDPLESTCRHASLSIL